MNLSQERSEFIQWLAALQVHKQQSFSLAAEVLGVKPSYVSRLVSELEEQLGYRLFERGTRSMMTLPYARQVLERFKKTFDEFERLKRQVHSQDPDI